MSTFRIAPAMPVSAYKTYELKAPIATHYRIATCQEVECEQYARGWITRCDTSTDIGVRQAKYIVDKSGRAFREITSANHPNIRAFKFSPGQRCFATHQVSLERNVLYVVRGGDWRGNPRGERRVHTKAEHWVEDFSEHQSKLANEIQKG